MTTTVKEMPHIFMNEHFECLCSFICYINWVCMIIFLSRLFLSSYWIANINWFRLQIQIHSGLNTNDLQTLKPIRSKSRHNHKVKTFNEIYIYIYIYIYKAISFHTIILSSGINCTSGIELNEKRWPQSHLCYRPCIYWTLYFTHFLLIR